MLKERLPRRRNLPKTAATGNLIIAGTRRNLMNSDQLQGKWKQIKGSVKERWGKLTDDDLNVIDGKHDQLVGKIQEKYGIARDAAQKQVDEWNAVESRQSELDERRKAS
jgi:uncharacterized protein YjbJ (UPF0337 family)